MNKQLTTDNAFSFRVLKKHLQEDGLLHHLKSSNPLYSYRNLLWFSLCYCALLVAAALVFVV